jgi:uncharacterized RDD family membrane protein YckC
VTQPPGYGPPLRPGHPVPPGYGPSPYGPPGYPPPGFPPPGFYPPPVPVSPAGVPLADFGSRLLAQLIDALLVGIVLAIVLIPTFLLIVTQVVFRTDDANPSPFTTLVPIFGLEAGFFLLSLALWYVYAVELMYRSGQTFGKRIMKIRVVPLDPRLPLTRLTAFKRYAAQFLPSVFVPFYTLIDDLWPLWDKPFQQALHDKAAQTVVVKVSA